MKAVIRKIDTAREGLGKTLGISLALILSLSLFSIRAEAQRSVIEVLKSPPSLSESQAHYLSVQTKEAAYQRHDLVAIDVEAIRKGQIALNVFGKSHTVRRFRIDKRGPTRYSWFGRTSDPTSSAVMVVNGDMVTGFFTFDMTRYMLYPLGEGIHMMVETDMSAFSADESPEDYRDMLIPKNIEEPKNIGLDPYLNGSEGDAKSNANCSIRYLIAYTDDVNDALADVTSFIQGCVDDHNAVNELSQGFHRVELARSVEVNYAENGDRILDLGRFVNTNDGFFDNIHDLRSLYDADVCQLIVNFMEEGFCGRADAVGASYSSAFAVTARGCAIGNHTFAHETGHLYGARHDTYVSSTNTPFAYGHGFVNLGPNSFTRWRTVMGLNDECTDAGTSCTRLGRWSNPSLAVGGIATGSFSTEDNARVAENEEATLSAFEATVSNKAFFLSDFIDNEEEGHIEGSTSITMPAAGVIVVYGSGSSGSARAPDIRLTSGFWALSGSEFVAFDGDCGDPQALGLVQFDEADDHSVQNHGLAETVLSGESNGDLFTDLEVFPNPFKESTTVRFSLSEARKATLTLRDILGREALQIANATEMTAGQHIVEVQTSALPTGIYLLTLQAGDDVIVKKIVKGN